MTKTQKLMAKQVTIGMPHIVALILSLLAGAAQVLIVGRIIPLPLRWTEMGIVLLTFFAGIGINPLVGHAAYAAIKLKPGLANLVSALLAALSTAAMTLTLPHTTEAVILGVLTFAAGMGFQSDVPAVSPPLVTLPVNVGAPPLQPMQGSTPAPAPAQPAAELHAEAQGFVQG